MEVYIVLMMRQIEGKVFAETEKDVYIKDVYNKKHQAEKAGEEEFQNRGGKYKPFIIKKDLKSKFKPEIYKI